MGGGIPSPPAKNNSTRLMLLGQWSGGTVGIVKDVDSTRSDGKTLRVEFAGGTWWFHGSDVKMAEDVKLSNSRPSINDPSK